jgi:nucleoside-diphosphate-sugar epimerase
LAERDISVRAMYWPNDGVPEISNARTQIVPADLRDKYSLRAALEGIEVVYNIAALYRPTNVSNRMYWDVNVEGTRNIVELAAEAGIKRFVHCSIIGIHGTIGNPSATEEASLKRGDYYQYPKLKGEELCREISAEKRLPVAIVRPAAIYGIEERRFFMLAKLIQEGRFIMFGDGRVLYHFIHINYLCAAFMLCAEKEEAIGETFIIADDHAITLNDINRIIADALGVPPPRVRLPLFVLTIPSPLCEFACKPFKISPPLHRHGTSWFIADRAFDISKARKVLGYGPQVTPDEGLKIMTLSCRKAGLNSLMPRLRTVLQRWKTYAAFPFRGCREAVPSPPRRST